MGFLRRISGLFGHKTEISRHVRDVLENKPIEEPASLSGSSFGRNYQPGDNEVFYHYCSAETFQAMVQYKTIRFSDINMMNDYGETGWGYSIFIEACNRILEMGKTVPALKGINKQFLKNIDEVIGASQNYVHPVIACFSRDPDVLSQWRAYADNGRGFAVGFSGRVLKNLPVTILEIDYNKENQISEVTNAIGAIYMQYTDAKKTFDGECTLSARLLAAYLFAYKNPGFSEENEVRCVHLLDVERSSAFIRLVDAGGTAGSIEVEGEKVKFRVNDGGIIAFIDVPFDRNNAQPLIEKLVMGPSNQNSEGNVRYLLGSEGFHAPEILRSETTFRV